MAKFWNLDATEWSDVWLHAQDPSTAADALVTKGFLPWSQTLLHLTKDSQSVLDLGSGRGEHSAVLALNGKKTTLLDWAPNNLSFSVNLFKALNIDAGFVLADMTKSLPFEDNSFDAVFSCGVFEYFSDEQIKSILGEAFRVSRNRVIIMAPNALSIPYRAGKWYMEKTKKWNWGGERPFYTLKPYFRSSGFVRILEFSVDAKHSLKFLPKGAAIEGLMNCFVKSRARSKPASLRQGYLVVTVGQKELSG